MEATIPIFYFKKKDWNDRKWEHVLLYINIDSKCQNINIKSVSITGRAAKVLQKFPRIPRFRF